MKYEHVVVEQLRGYGRMLARLKVLQATPVGNGMRLSHVSGDDKLQELHKKLRGMPSKLYLTKREQEVETVARTYLKSYPLGTKAQLREAKLLIGETAHDHALLRELTSGIQAVLEARVGTAEGIDGVLERLAEIQDIEQEKARIDEALAALEEYKATYSRLLRLRYIEGKAVEDVADELCVSRRTFERWRPQAVREYANLVGFGHLR
jgi:DNA-directed RNA polymerase specialized sigma24 family protein